MAKDDFNWDDVPDAKESEIPVPAVQQAAPSDFNWDDVPSSEEQETPQTPDVSKMESFLRAAIQVPAMGFADEIVGGAKAGLDVLSGRSPSQLESLYRAYRDAERRKYQAAEEANPGASLAGTVAGGIGTAFIPGLNAMSVPRAAALGGAASLGGSDADLTQGELGEAAVDTAMGAALGGTLQKAVPAIGKAIGGVRESLQEAGEGLTRSGARSAYSSLKPSNKDMEKFIASERSSSDVSLPKLIDKYVKPFGGPEESGKLIAKRIDDIELEKAAIFKEIASGKKLDPKTVNDKVKTALDEIADKAALESPDLTMKEKASLAGELREIFNNYLEPLAELPKFDEAGNLIEESVKRGKRNFSDLLEVDAIRKQIGEEISGSGFKTAQKIASGEMPAKNRAILLGKREAYDRLRNLITELGDDAGGTAGSRIRKLNMEESNLINLLDTVKPAHASVENATGGGMFTGQMMALGSSAVGALGGASMGVPGMIAGGALGYGTKQLVEKIAGQSSDKILKAAAGKRMMKTGKNLQKIADSLKKVEPAAQKTGEFISSQADAGLTSSAAQGNPFIKDDKPKSLAAFGDKQLADATTLLSNSGDEKLSQYADHLNRAIESGNTHSKNAAIFLIMQNPKARELLGLTEENE